MTAPTHILFAGIVLSLAERAFPEMIQASWQTYVIAALGGVFPDIDEPNSFIGRRAWWIAWPFKMVFGHRGITHSGLALLALCCLSIQVPELSAWLIPFSIGVASHIVADAMTPQGVPLLFPLNRRVAAPVTIRTGGVGEMFFFLTLIGLAVWLHPVDLLASPEEFLHASPFRVF